MQAFLENLKRIARDENTDICYINEDIKYKEWYKKYVTKEESIDIISKSNPLVCKNFDELDSYCLANYNLNISDEIKNFNFENAREVLEDVDCCMGERLD